jgi:hypothetical protein
MGGNQQALAHLRTEYLLRFRGKLIPEAPRMSRKRFMSAYDFLNEQYADALSEIISQVPTDRFTDQELFVMAALCYAYLAQYPIAKSSDDIEWNYNRQQLQRVILDGVVKVGGRAASYTVRSWSSCITRVQRLIDDSDWMIRKPGNRGVNTRMIPTDLTHALHNLPAIRTDHPTLSIPAFTTSLYYTASASETGAWMDLREVVSTAGLTWLAAYDQRASKVAVGKALRAAGVPIADMPNGSVWGRSVMDRVTGERYLKQGEYTERLIRLPEGMAFAEAVSLIVQTIRDTTSPEAERKRAQRRAQKDRARQRKAKYPG